MKCPDDEVREADECAQLVVKEWVHYASDGRIAEIPPELSQLTGLAKAYRQARQIVNSRRNLGLPRVLGEAEAEEGRTMHEFMGAFRAFEERHAR